MTESTPSPELDLARVIMESTARMIAESRAIDTRKSLEGIKSRRLPPRARKHSVFHKSYR